MLEWYNAENNKTQNDSTDIFVQKHNMPAIIRQWLMLVLL